MGNLLFLLKRDDLAGFSVRAIVLTVMLLVALLVGLLVAWPNSNQLAACQLAFALVLPCSVAGLFAGEFPRGSDFAVLRMSGTLFARSGLLLFFLLIARKWDLSNTGFIYYILAFYAIGLSTDVVLSSFKTWQWISPDSVNKDYADEGRSSELAAN